jgi:hypothetical protein
MFCRLEPESFPRVQALPQKKIRREMQDADFLVAFKLHAGAAACNGPSCSTYQTKVRKALRLSTTNQCR